jgi:mannosyltransferase OCH1-like enzyme
MQGVVHCRIRTIFLFSLTVFLLLSAYISWPWFFAAWIWRKSTIDFVDFPIVSTLNESLSNVPAIIHQTWRDNNTIPITWQHASNSCRSLHPNYEYRFWTDQEGRRLIEKEFPCLLSTYDSYPYDIQRADVIRLIVLYIYGGIYLDFDIICLKSFDQLRTYKFVLPKTMPVGLSNDFIVAEPKHPFLLKVLNDLPKFNQNFFTK